MDRRVNWKGKLFVNVSLVDLAPCKKLLKVEYGTEEVSAAIEEAASLYQKNVTVPGFRAGKAPREKVLNLHGKAIYQRASQNLVEKGFQEAVKKEDLKPVGNPRLEEDAPLENGKPFSFNITIELAPTFELPDYKGLPVTLEKHVIGDEQVNKAILVLQERMCSYKDTDRNAQEKDVVVINYTGSCEGKPITEIVPTAQRIAKADNFWVRITKDSFLPGFTEQLVGLKAGDKKTVTIDFPADFVEPELAGKKGTFEITVVLVKEVELPTLDDKFAGLYGVKTLEELKTRVHSDLEQDARYKEKQSIEAQIAKALLEKVDFELPDSLLELETAELVERVLQQNRERKVREEVIQRGMPEIKANAAKQAASNLKLNFIFGKIAEAEKLKASEEEMRTRITILAQMNKVPLQKFVKRLQENRGFNQIASEIVRGKVLELLKLHSVVKEVPVQVNA
jgi:trigger factor